jgi:hypothetical protein
MRPVYNWEISAGTIVAGQGTRRLTVNHKSSGGATITATVTVSNLNLSDCTNLIKDDCSTYIEPGGLPNQPPTVGLSADKVDIKVCPGNPALADPRDSIVKLFTTATDPDGDTLTYSYKVSGGKILEAEGPNAMWRLSNVKSGKYTATVTVSDGKGLPVSASVTVSVSSCLPGAAGDTTRPEPVKRGANEFGIWGGGSLFSSTVIGTTEDTRLGILGLRYSRTLVDREPVAFKYTFDAIPVLVMSYPRFEFFPGGVVRRTRNSAYGLGLTPIGFQLNFRARKRLQPFIGISGGFIYFPSPVPDARGKSFNFTADLGGGIQLINTRGRALTIGYKYHHLSNGYRGEINPGFDSNIFYFGYSVFK